MPSAERSESRKENGLGMNPAFLRLWMGQGISMLGSQVSNFALPLVAVALLHAGEFELGAVNAASTIAFLLVGLPSGAWVDRWLKRRTMIVADLVRMGAIAVIPALWWSGWLTVWHLVVIAAVLGFATVFFDVAYQSYLPIILEHSQMQSGNSRLEATSQVAQIGGPAAGGLLLRVVTAPTLLVVDAVSYGLSALFLSRIRDGEERRPASDHRPIRVEIAEGVRFVAGHRSIRRIVATTATSNLFGTLSSTLLPFLILRTLHLGATGLGFTYSAGAVGGLLGALATPRIVAHIGEARAIAAGAGLSGLAMAGLPLAFVFSDVALPLVMAGEFVSLFMILLYNITQLSLRQRLCPPALLGRMNASIRFVVYGVLPIGSLSAGLLATAFGTVPTLVAAAIGTTLSAGFVVGPGLVPDTDDD